MFLEPLTTYSDTCYRIMESFRTTNGITQRLVEEFDSLFSAHFALNEYRIRDRTRVLEVVNVYREFGEGIYNYE